MKVSIQLIVILSGIIMATGCVNQSETTTAASKEEVVMENILNRKSVRQYQNRGVEKEKIAALLKAGMAAPSGMDRRPWNLW